MSDKPEYPINEAIFGRAFRDLPDGVDEMRAKYAWSNGPVIAIWELTPEMVREAERLGFKVTPVKPK